MCVVCCSILESAVEDIRRDVVVRRCRVHEREVDGLVGAVQKTLKAISQAKGQLNLPWLPHRIWGFNYTTHWSPESQFTFLLQTHTQWKNQKIKTLRCRIQTQDLSVTARCLTACNTQATHVGLAKTLVIFHITYVILRGQKSRCMLT